MTGPIFMIAFVSGFFIAWVLAICLWIWNARSGEHPIDNEPWRKGEQK